MKTLAPNTDPSGSPFDAIRRVRPDGTEYWNARQMQPLMGYSRWQTMGVPLNRARVAARNQGLDVSREFSQVSQVTRLSNLGDQGREDYELSRIAAYLLAMNGDPKKPEVAAAQMYFAAKAREAELVQTNDRGLPSATGAQVALAMAQQLVEQEQRLATVEASQAATAAKVEAIEGRHDWFTALGYAKLHDHATERTYLSRVGRRATALAKDRGDTPHPRQDATFGTVNTYPVYALAQAFAEVTS